MLVNKKASLRGGNLHDCFVRCVHFMLTKVLKNYAKIFFIYKGYRKQCVCLAMRGSVVCVCVSVYA